MDQPPKYMQCSSLKCEGYWNNNYRPVISNVIWKDKKQWLTKALFVEKHTNKICYRGLSFSRIDGTVVGNCEYYDNYHNICWPEGYIEHYIKDHNVMPTERFYHYINNQYNLLILFYYIKVLFNSDVNIY